MFKLLILSTIHCSLFTSECAITFGVFENTLGIIRISFGVSRISVGFPISTTKIRQKKLAVSVFSLLLRSSPVFSVLFRSFPFFSVGVAQLVCNLLYVLGRIAPGVFRNQMPEVRIQFQLDSQLIERIFLVVVREIEHRQF